ncbi:MAG: hypothetical protein ABIA75_08230 [Candidatus Neomarinimicrobiota bacterium]
MNTRLLTIFLFAAFVPNTAINNQFAAAGGIPGPLTGGTKKDVVLSNKIIDPTRPDHVVI